jgi:hypothetical protein
MEKMTQSPTNTQEINKFNEGAMKIPWTIPIIRLMPRGIK